MNEFQLRLKKLQRRDWLLWWASVMVMLLLTLAIASFTLPALYQGATNFFQFNLDQAVRGLVGAVLLFNTYAIYQQIIVKRLHRKLAEQMEATAKLESYAEALHKMAMLDPLTGLHNRRFAEERLEAEVARSHRSGHPLTVIMLDLDDFKQINDRYGHPAGDLVLKGFADRLKALVRVSDLAVRLGGDEFLLLLVDCAADMAERLASRIGTIQVVYQGTTIPVSFCAGWAGCRPGEASEKLLERADRALYEAKRRTKSRQVTVPA
ncbi:MAG: GGDEF domain-containing protein [Acidobacteria bacterium]|nr:GGDEF domain-containing protein [Acidobacteriota bacterium]MBI3663885.1 GGDEF domain-containing protein [Acidobacteriota bacterium]